MSEWSLQARRRFGLGRCHDAAVGCVLMLAAFMNPLTMGQPSRAVERAVVCGHRVGVAVRYQHDGAQSIWNTGSSGVPHCDQLVVGAAHVVRTRCDSVFHAMAQTAHLDSVEHWRSRSSVPLVALGMATFVVGRQSFPIPTRPNRHRTLADILRGLLVGLCVAFCLLMQRFELVQTFRILAVVTSYVFLVFVQ